jgi:hypothetical protein
MNGIIGTLIYVTGAFVFWLGPLYLVCKWAESMKKNFRIVGLVGLLTSWIIALIVMLCLPILTDAEMVALRRQGQSEPMGETAVILIALGVMSAVALGAIGFLAWAV